MRRPVWSQRVQETRPEQVRHDVGVVRLFEPVIREVESPLTEEMLRPLDPRCEVVQFGHPLSDADFQTLADWLRDYPAVTLRAFADGTGAELDFLRFFPTLRAFHADFSYRTLVSLDGLNHLPADLTYLGLGQTKKRLSLAPLARFTELQRLYLEGQSKDIEVIGHLRTITSLTLRSITLPNLSLLVPLTRLRALDLKLGGTRDLALLPEVGSCNTWSCGWFAACTTSPPSRTSRRWSTSSSRRSSRSPPYRRSATART